MTSPAASPIGAFPKNRSATAIARYLVSCGSILNASENSKTSTSSSSSAHLSTRERTRGSSCTPSRSTASSTSCLGARPPEYPGSEASRSSHRSLILNASSLSTWHLVSSVNRPRHRNHLPTSRGHTCTFKCPLIGRTITLEGGCHARASPRGLLWHPRSMRARHRSGRYLHGVGV